jgi:hypothetical protein
MVPTGGKEPRQGVGHTAHPASAVGRTFTVSEANAALPLVKAIVTDLVELSRDVAQRRQRLLSLSRPDRRRREDPYEEELIQMERELEADAQRIGEYVDELRQLGVEAKSATDGVVDFPAVLDGRLIYLCWQLGEPEVAHWHERDAGYRGRQRIDWVERGEAGADGKKE